MPNFSFQFNRLSFWLGFLAASLFWWLVNRIRPLVPVWWQQLRHEIELISARNLSVVDEYLRHQTILRAQSQHLSAALFPLDDVVIEPRLLVPPSGQDPNDKSGFNSIASAVIPYLPDWPELAAPFGVPTLTLDQALQSKRHIAVIGQPGSGKSVALAYLASQIARREPALGENNEAIPLYIHVVDLDTRLNDAQDPVQSLIKSIAATGSVVMQPQIIRYLQAVIRNKQFQIVLLLDGLDELPQEPLLATVAYLTALIAKLPRLQIITTASGDFIDGLTQAGFYPLAISAWNMVERKTFARRWGDLWMTQVMPEIAKRANIHPIDAKLMEYWLDDETSSASPMEWTLRIWGAYAGNLSGTNGLDILRSHLMRSLPDPAILPAVEQLAHTFMQNKNASMSFDEMERQLTGFKTVSTEAQPAEVTPLQDQAAQPPVDPPAAAAEPSDSQAVTALEEEQEAAKKITKKLTRNIRKKNKKITTQGEQIIESLIAGGILAQHTNDQLRFTSPILLGLLASAQTTPEEATDQVSSLNQAVCWPAQLQTLRYTAACDGDAGWMMPLVNIQDPPLFHNLLIFARWLGDAPLKANWRTMLMRNLVTLVQNETLPFSIRSRFIAALYLAGDPSVDKLFKQLLVSRSPAIRRMALLGCGALGSSHLTDPVLSMLADKQPEVRFTACLALSAIPGESTLKAIVDILLSGDEEIRQAAAESLSQNPDEGYQVLREAAVHDDLLARHAAVFGLVQVRQEWAQKALEKMAVEDGQWVVRNAAAQALDQIQNTLPPVPARLPTPSEAGWLLTFASKLGMGIQPGQPGTDVLMTVLKTGTVEEQIAALCYMRDQPTDETIHGIYGLLDNPEEHLREAAVYALWWMVISGVKLPSMN